MDDDEKLENDVQSVKDGTEQAIEKKSSLAESGEGLIKKTIQQATKTGVQEKAVTQAISSVFSAIAPYLGIIAFVVFILITIIGLVGFLLNMPGLMKDKLRAITNGISDWWEELYKTSANIEIKDEDIVELANYIEGMGYDLIGFGFVSPSSEDYIATYESLKDRGYEVKKNGENVYMINSSGETYKNVFVYKDGYLYNGISGERLDKKSNNGQYTKNGIIYDSDGKIVSPGGLSNVNASTLKKYAIANARNKFLRNEDDNNNIVNWFHDVFVGDDADPNDVWSRGLIYLYDSHNFIANNKFGGSDGISLFGSVELKNNGKTLRLKRGLNNAMEFNTEGWSSRYGLTQDFLISLHLATLSPELVESIVENFDTEVQVYLDEVDNAEAKVKLIDKASSVIGISDGNDYNDNNVGLTISDFTEGKVADAGIDINDEWADIDSWYLSNKKAAKFFKLADLSSPTNCVNGCDYGLADFEKVKGSNTESEYLRDFPSSWILLNSSDKDYVYKMAGGDGANQAYSASVGYWDHSADEEAQNILVSSKVKSMVKNALEDYTDYGFSYEKFCKQVKMEATGDTAVKNLLTNDLADVYEPDGTNEKAYYDLETLYNEDFDNVNLGYLYGTLCLKDSNGNYVEDCYDKIWNKLKTDNQEINSEDYNYLKYHVGQECIYERGKPYVIDSESHQAYYSHLKGGFCHCDFCSTFYNKYSALQEFVNYQLLDSKYLQDGETSFANYDELISEGEIDYYWYQKGTENERLYAVSNLYEWVYNDQSYRISFYYDEDMDRNLNGENKFNTAYGAIGLIISKGWSDEQWNEWIEYKNNNDISGCSALIKNAEDPTDVKLCSSCKKYAKYLIWSMLKINDNKYKTYVPYIARVVNSWFRDTYFIIPDEDTTDYAIEKAVDEFGYDKNQLAGENVSVIENNDAFLEDVGELWTSYVKYNGNYATFLLDSEGKLFTDTDSIERFLNRKGVFGEDKLLLEKYIKYEYDYKASNTGTDVKSYGLWIAETDSELQNEEEKKANETLKKYNISVTKISVNKNISDIQNIGVNENGIIWNAYGNGAETTKWQEIEIDKDSPYYMRYVDRNNENIDFYVGLKGVYNFVQLADAQRGMTNSKIKYLFKNKKYYKYDGSTERAYAIYNDWLDCKSIFGSEEEAKKVIDNYYLYNESTDVVFSRDFNDDGIADISSTRDVTLDIITLKPIKYDENITKITSDPRNPSLIDNIDLNLESLTAFSILENTQSVDAEYAYRDLKELMVELDYFDTEDLVEPAKEVLEWLVPEAGSATWPKRLFDKSIEYGTLIHSKDMYNNLNEINKEAIIKDDTTNKENSNSEKQFNGYDVGQAIVSPATAKILEIGTVTVDNESKEKILKSYYKKSDSNDNNSNEESDFQKLVVTDEEYNAISKKAQEKQDDDNSSFGKSYKTGYVKLEIIGNETLEKFKSLGLDQYYEGLEAFYEDYYNKANNKSVCDSYTLYIEGIDLTGDLEQEGSSGLSSDLSNTILAKLFDANSTSGEKFSGKTNSEVSTDNSNNTSIDGIDINYYTRKIAPKYYTSNAKNNMNQKEDKKEELPAIIKIKNTSGKGSNSEEIYIKAGTTLGITGNANIKIIMKNKKNEVVENVDEYLEIEKDSKWADNSLDATVAGSSASEYYLAWHIQTYGQMAIPACGSWYTNYGDKINGEPVEYTNNDTGYVPNLMPELAMQGQNLSHLGELGYDTNKLASFSYIGRSGNNPVKLVDVLDTYYLYINNAANDIKNRVSIGRELTQYELDALIETYIWGCSYTYSLINQLNANGYLTVRDFENLHTYLDGYAPERKTIAGNLFNTDSSKYPNGYFSNISGQYLTFKTNTPFSDMVFKDALSDDVMTWN